MKQVRNNLGILFAIASLSFTAQAYCGGTPWGAKELASAGVAATSALAQEYGQEAVVNTRELSVRLRSTGTAARATIIFMENGEEVTATFGCHNHGADIDCH